jgi:hypothetical protein
VPSTNRTWPLCAETFFSFLLLPTHRRKTPFRRVYFLSVSFEVRGST